MKPVSNTEDLSSVIATAIQVWLLYVNIFSVWKAEYGDSCVSIRMKENDLK